MTTEINWQGTVVAIQPRIRLTRSFDERSHSYLGYALRLQGGVGDVERESLVGVGKAAHAKHQFRAGDVLSGQALAVADRKTEAVEFYKASGLKLIARGAGEVPSPPPWLDVPPELPVYRKRGHRRLDAHTYQRQCSRCLWGCQMPVEMIVDQWNPRDREYRFETFCYGPKSCALYRAGLTRKVPGRRGMSWEEADWVDEEATAHRGEDE
jgi:hypothetical protein